jgi:hypothetical protein
VRQARTALDVRGQEIILGAAFTLALAARSSASRCIRSGRWDSALSMDHLTVSPTLSAILMF